MAKLNYLNLGCGDKWHPDWVNIDMVSNHPNVIAVNLLKGIPYPDNQFDVIYHSQVLEHIPKEDAPAFIKECLRVLKPGGILRIVVPDLENIVSEYLKHLKQNLENPTARSEADYDWILMEMYDQTVRNYSGGQMAEYLRNPNLINEEYVLERTGQIGRTSRDELSETNTPQATDKVSIKKLIKNAVKKSIHPVKNLKKLATSKRSRVGAFRLGGEVHMWMYDRFSLGRLLKNCGFTDVRLKNPFDSDIPKWSDYELDVRDGKTADSMNALFMEGRKAADQKGK